MSMSIYYTSERERPLTESEQAAINALLQRYSVEDQLQERERTGQGPNWESFCVYDPKPREPRVVFEGATKLPDNSAENFWIGIRHWCALLTEIRRVLPDAEWSVQLEDADVHWDGARQAYDPSVPPAP